MPYTDGENGEEKRITQGEEAPSEVEASPRGEQSAPSEEQAPAREEAPTPTVQQPAQNGRSFVAPMQNTPYAYSPNGWSAPPRKPSGGRTWLICILAVLLVLGSLGGGVLIGRLSYRPLGGGGTTTVPGGNGVPSVPTVDRGDVTIEVVERENGVPQDGTLPAVVSSVRDAVVEIRTTTTVTSYYYDNYVQSGAGSGVLIRTSGDVKGLLLTCNHVIDGADKNGITVVLTDGREFSGEQVTVLGQDVWSDLALLQITDEDGSAPEGLSYATMATGKGGASDYSYMTVGETVVAIGNPLGSLGGSVSRGIISAVGREVSVEGCPMTLMQVDASVNPGNSGGGLFNMDGQLIGIVNAKSTGDSVEGIGFAIPTSDAIPLVAELYKQGYVSGRPYLGLFFNPLTSSGYYTIAAYRYTDELPEGTTIESGDYLYSIDGVKITSNANLRSALADKKEGDTVEVVLIRVQYRQQTEVKLTLKVHAYTPQDAVYPAASGE